MEGSKTVYTLAGVQFVEHVYKNTIKRTEPQFIPYIVWPNGTPCNYANLYILHLNSQSFSTLGKGGSLKQYGYTLSRYVRFCAHENIDLLDLSSQQFVKFFTTLRTARLGGKRNTERTAVANGKLVLGFLHYLDSLFGTNVTTGRLGAKRKVTKFIYNNRTFITETWSHPSFGAESPKKRRSAIETGTIQALQNATVDSAKDDYVIARRQILLKTLEITGARIGECAEIKVDDVKEARQSLMLRLKTLKRRGPHTRELPILRQDLSDLDTFLILRKIAIKKRGVKDDGYLFFSTRTSRKMTAASLSNEVGLLRRQAKISEQASAHLFRHRFITRIIIHLIEAHEIDTPEHMRRALQEIESLKVIVSQWTGHASLASLDTYIDTAFSEWKHMRKSVDKAFVRRAYDTFEAKAAKLVEKLNSLSNMEEFRAQFAELQQDLRTDKQRSVKQI